MHFNNNDCLNWDGPRRLSAVWISAVAEYKTSMSVSCWETLIPGVFQRANPFQLLYLP